MNEDRREIEVVVLSDIHLGTYGCHARELNKYLKSIKPKKLILNGDIIDIWQFSKRYWPKSHMKVLKQIINLAAKGTRVYYITGNHDETLRKFAGVKMGKIEILNKLELKLDGKKAWIFHGDIFDVIMQHSKWLAKFGAISYDALIILNVIVNKTRQLFGKGKLSISKKVKENVKTAVNFICSFEETVSQLGMKKGFDYVICGHIHHPEIKLITDTNGKTISYLNSGDWIENLTALEYNNKEWKLYSFQNDYRMKIKSNEADEPDILLSDLDNKEIFNRVLQEFTN